MQQRTLALKQAEMRNRHRTTSTGETITHSNGPDETVAEVVAESIVAAMRSEWLPSKWLVRSVGERYFSPRQVALKYSVSYWTARRWIKSIMGDDERMTPKNKGRGKRHYRLRRVPQSLLEKHIDEFING